jgi:DNA-damage-inducible protein J
MTDIRVRIPDELKINAECLFSEMGMTMSEAVRIFLTQSVNSGGLPFTPKAPRPNAETLAAFSENKDDLKSYSDVDSMFKDLGLE